MFIFIVLIGKITIYIAGYCRRIDYRRARTKEIVYITSL